MIGAASPFGGRRVRTAKLKAFAVRKESENEKRKGEKRVEPVRNVDRSPKPRQHYLGGNGWHG